MFTFEMHAILWLLFEILAIFFLIATLVSAIKEHASKNTKWSIVAMIANEIAAFLLYSNIVVPPPAIMPLNSATEIYMDNVKVTIKSDGSYFMKTYYTLDGEDPKDDGDIYRDTITLSESATVCARCKFFWKWSDIEQRAYIFDENDNKKNALEEVNENNASEGADDYDFTIETQVRLERGEDNIWRDTIEAEVGDKVQFQLTYKNISNALQENVMIKSNLPNNLRYVPDSTKLRLVRDGEQIDMDIIDGAPSDILNGINIGDFLSGTNGQVMFTAEVVDKNLAEGTNTLINWGLAGVGGKARHDEAKIHVQKD